MNQEVYHIPALLLPTLDGLAIEPDGIYVDATLGGGGHTRGILERLGPNGHLYSFDQDIDAIERCTPDPRFTPVHSNFRFMANWMDYYGVLGKVDGIMADLGVSSHHFDDASRGFSFRADGPLDMRMNTSAKLTAAQLIENADLDELTRIFRLYGELKPARRLAEVLKKELPQTTMQLADIASPLLNPARVKKDLAQVFQALRIAVNGEMQALEQLLNAALESLRPGGRLAIITYHSLEDRMVKNFFRAGNIDGKEEKDFFGRSSAPLKPISSKPIVPDDAEIESNPRSRSAKLRVAVKL